MNTVQDHLDKAKRNRDFLLSLTVADANANWAIIVLFYRALHLARAYIHHAGRHHGQGHVPTNNEVQALFSAPLSMSYLRLYSRSRLCRYDDLGAVVDDYARLDANDFSPLLAFIQGALSGAV